VTAATTEGAMPTDFAVAYQAWLVANPTKSGRLAMIVVATVGALRGAVRAQLGYDPDPDDTTVPDQAQYHAENLVFFKLGMEMGLSFEPQVYNLYNQANIWLRMVASGSIKIDVGDVRGTPSYEAHPRRDRVRFLSERALA
jgi:hypothetical protein